MEKFSELIRIRRSMRKFTEEELTQDEVVALLRAALISPSSTGVRPWEFVVVDNKDLLQQLAHCKEHGAELIEGAPLAVVILADPTQSDVWVEDASVATTMMLLQAEDLGLGSCWCQIRNRQMEDDTDAAQYVRGLLDVPYQLDVLSIIGIGYKDQERKPFDESHLQWEKIHLGTFRMPIENEQGKV